MELSKLQQKIIDKKNNKIVVISSSASGKTRLLTEKVRQLLKNKIEPKKIAVITFTNMAAEELRQRLGEDYKDGIFIGTIHSLANYFLLSSGIETSKIINNEKFDELFYLVKKNPQCIKDIEYLLLDEAQDTGTIQFDFIFNMINPDNFFVVGDLKQSIYGFNGAKPQLLEELCKEEDVSVYSLNENYRNGKNILNFAKKIIEKTGLYDDSIPMSKNEGKVYEVELSFNGIAKTIKKRGNYGTWAILTRSNAQIDEVTYFLKKYDLPFDTFKQGDLTRESLTEKMNEDTIKVLTIHSSKGLEWENVVVIGARFYPSEERNVAYVAATRAKNTLVWTTYPKKQKKVSSWE